MGGKRMQKTEIRTENRRQGLSDRQAEESRKRYGSNVLKRQAGKPFFRQFLSNLNDPVIRILLCALAVDLILTFQNADWVESAGIAGAVFLATMISTLSERSSEKAFARLSSESDGILCRVRRNGSVAELPLCEIVVGDVVLLSAGEMIPADGILFRGKLSLDQSSMTGESREVEKIPSADGRITPESPSALFRGSTILSGSGEFSVTAVGDATFLGEISREVQAEQRESPLKIRLAKLAKQISILGYVAAILVALAYLFHVFILDSGMRWELVLLKLRNTTYLFSRLFHAFTLGLTVIVVAVPEGLPMMIAVVLSSNIRKMIRDQVLVRKPVGIEAAGSMNLLFTDKTGTLTEGKMRVTDWILSEGETLSDAEKIKEKTPLVSELLSMAFRGKEATLGTDQNGNLCAMGGNATERALLDGILTLPEPTGNVTSRLLFDSTRKYSAVTWNQKGEKKTFLVGAPERLFPYVRKEFGNRGEILPFSSKRVQNQIQKQTIFGKRVLIVAVSEDGIPAEEFSQNVPQNLIFLCAVCLADPIRKEAPAAVNDLRGAGVQVVMITGDSRETASQIAQTCGILNDRQTEVLSGEELARLSDAKLRELLPRLAVVARALPTDKSRLVRISEELGFVTGMTGDGINDAPALRRADVGFAMGSGTQVAKDAGDIIILDNNLSSIVRAVLYGRTIFKSIRKFITLQLTMNFSAVGVTMICPFLGIDSPVTVVQMLWINLIMDTLGGLAFAGEPPLPEYMKEPPKKRDESILNRYMVHQISLLGGFTVAVSLLFLKHPFFTSRFRPGENQIYLLTAFFAFFIFASVFNCFNARTDRRNLFAGLRKNPVFLLIMSAVLFIQILFVYLGGTVLRTAPLTPKELAVAVLSALLVFPADFLRKTVWKLFHKGSGF